MNDQKVPLFFQCTKCLQVLKCDVNKGTKKLNAHANACADDDDGNADEREKKRAKIG